MACLTCIRNREKKKALLNKKIASIEQQLKDPSIAPADFQRLNDLMIRLRKELAGIK